MNVTITYDTPADKVTRAVEIVKEILDDHEGMDANYPPQVYFSDLNDTSLNLFVIYWYHPADYWAFCAFNEHVNLEIFRRFSEEEIDFAYPTQTLYLAGDRKRPLVLDNRENGRSSAGAVIETSGDSANQPNYSSQPPAPNRDNETPPAVESAGTDVDNN